MPLKRLLLIVTLSLFITEKSLSEVPVEHSNSILQLNKLVPEPNNQGGADSEFGYSISVNGTKAAVGAPDAAGHGIVYVFELHEGSWGLTQEVINDDPFNGEGFGSAVYLTDEYMFVGSPSSGSGSVTVFNLLGGEWIQQQELHPFDGENHDEFGYSISSFGGHLIIGSPDNDQSSGTNDTGAVYTYSLIGKSWQFSQKIVPGDVMENDRFGRSVSVSADRLMVGAPFYSQNAREAGAVYEYRFDGQAWQSGEKLIPADNGFSDFFGYRLFLESDRLVASALYGSDGFNGSVYYFEHDGTSWQEMQEITAGDMNSTGKFGYSLDLSGDRLVIGASGAGVTFMFTSGLSGWDLEHTLEPPAMVSGIGFGGAVAIVNDQVFCGATHDETDGRDAGAVFIYKDQQGVWPLVQQISSGESASYDEFGSILSAEGNDLLIGTHNDDELSGTVTYARFDGAQWNVEELLTAPQGTTHSFGRQVEVNKGRALISDGDLVVHYYELEQSGWVLHQGLTASQAQNDDYFGFSLEMDNNRLAIGAPGYETSSGQLGQVYTYEFSNEQWLETQRISPVSRTFATNFGEQIQLQGDKMMIAAPDTSGGTVYFYQHDGIQWIEQQQIRPTSDHSYAFFGISISFDNNRLVVAAYVNNNSRPAVFMFDYDGQQWSQSQVLMPLDGKLYYPNVSIKGDQVIIGNNSWYETFPVTDAYGGFYSFQFNGQSWIETEVIIPNDPLHGGYFGDRVIFDGKHIIVGSPRDNDSGTFSGSVYIYQVDMIYKNGFDG